MLPRSRGCQNLIPCIEISFLENTNITQRLPVEASTTILKARQNEPPTNGACDCLSGGEIAGIVLGSIFGSFLLWWLIRTAIRQSSDSNTHSYQSTRYERPVRRESVSPYTYREKPVTRSRRYRRRSIERPAKIYISGN